MFTLRILNITDIRIQGRRHFLNVVENIYAIQSGYYEIFYNSSFLALQDETKCKVLYFRVKRVINISKRRRQRCLWKKSLRPFLHLFHFVYANLFYGQTLQCVQSLSENAFLSTQDYSHSCWSSHKSVGSKTDSR